MKNISIVLSIVCLLLTSCPVAYVSADDAINAGDYKKAAEVMESLGILTGSGGNAFSYENNVTRGEFVQAFINLLNMQSYEPNSSYSDYVDVPSEHRYAAAIHTAVKLKLVTADAGGSFHPDETISITDATVIIIRGLGYEKYAVSRGGYPIGYIMQAQALKLYSGIATGSFNELNLGAASRLLYNCLDIDLGDYYASATSTNYKIVSGRNVMTEYLKINRGKGLLSQTYLTSVTGTSEHQAGKKQVVIGGRVFNKGACDADKYLGYSVEYYCREDDNKEWTLCYIAPVNTQIVTVESEDFISFADWVFTYESHQASFDEKINARQQLCISTTVDVIVNGKAYSDYTEDDVLLEGGYGFNLFIDNNSDDIYDVIIITQCVDYVVYQAYEEKKLISTRFPETLLDMSVYSKLYIEDASGRELGFGGIYSSDVITVMAARDNSMAKIIVSTNSMDTEINEIHGDNRITLSDGKEYIIDDCFRAHADSLKIGLLYTFLFDYRGRIAGTAQGQVGINYMYGYMCKLAKANGLRDEIEIKLYHISAEMKTFKIKDYVYLNGIKCSLPDFYNIFTAVENNIRYTKAQMIKYFLGSDGNTITHVLYDSGSADSIMKVNKYSEVRWNGDGMHLNTSAAFYPNTKTMIVPKVPAGQPKSLSNSFDERYYNVVQTLPELNYYVTVTADVVDPDPAGISRILVLYEDCYASPPPGGSDVYDTYKHMQCVMVDRWTKYINNKGEETTKLYFYLNNNLMSMDVIHENILKKAVYNEKGELLVGQNRYLKRGDIITYRKFWNGLISSITVEYDTERVDNLRFKGALLNTNYSIDCGIPYIKTDKGLQLLTTVVANAPLYDPDNPLATFDVNSRAIRRWWSPTDTVVTVYDTEKDKIVSGTCADIMDYTSRQTDLPVVFCKLSDYCFRYVFVIK